MSETAIVYETGTFAAADGLQLVWQAWAPDGGVAAALAVLHGYGEHGGRYAFLVADMVPRGYAVATYDLRGHGRSPGRRGHVDRFAEYLTDTTAFLSEVRRRYPDAPLFLLGHSVGGVIGAACCEDDDGRPADLGPAGLVLSSPFLRSRLPVSPVKIAAARVLSRVVPTMGMANPLRDEDLSHDPAVVAAAAADPLNHRVTTVRWAAEMLAAQTRVISGASRLRLPLLLLYSVDDVIADPRAGEELFERAGSADKTKRRYAGQHHEIFNDLGRAAVFADLADWLGGHVAAASSATPPAAP